MEEKKVKLPHTVIMDGRKSITLTGITATDNFDDEEIALFSDYGQITIRGEGLTVSVINTESGDVQATGRINSVTYSDRVSKKEGFMSRVFR